MALNAKPLPTGWIKLDMIVRCVNSTQQPPSVMRVRFVAEDGHVSARKAKSNRDDAILLPPSDFEPATLADYVSFHLDTLQIGENFGPQQATLEKRVFSIRFREALKTEAIDKLKKVFDKVDSTINTIMVVTVPQKWVDETDLVVEQSPETVQSVPHQRPQRTIADVGMDRAVVDWFVRSFVRLGVDMAGVQIAPSHRLGRTIGQDPTYTLIWPSTQAFSDNIKSISTAAKELRLREFFANDRYIKVDLPHAWTPTYGEVAAANVEYVAVSPETAQRLMDEQGLVYNEDGQLDAPVVEDDDLKETARRITELQDRNARLQDQLNAEREAAELALKKSDETIEQLQNMVDGLVQDIEGRELRAEDAAERMIEPLTTCKEVKTIRNINDADYQKFLNEGWEDRHIEFNDKGDVNVVFVRDLPAPVAPTSTRAAAKLIQTVGPHIIVEPTPLENVPSLTSALNYVQTPQTRAINYGTDIATARATLVTMLNDDEITHAAFVLNVRRSRLPRQEQDALVAESLKLRAGKNVAETFESLADLKPYVRLPFAISQAVNNG